MQLFTKLVLLFLTISGYVSSCVFGSLSGPLADIFGRKRMALVSKDLFFQITEKYFIIKTSYDNNNNFLIFLMYFTNYISNFWNQEDGLPDDGKNVIITFAHLPKNAISK